MASETHLSGGVGRALRRGSVVLAVIVGCLLTAPAALAATGSISGTVTAAEGGAPVQGVKVCAYYEASEETEPSCESSSSTGEYTIGDLPRGEYLVAFWAEKQEYAPQFWQDASSQKSATLVPVNAAPVEGIDAALAVGGKVSGRVTGEPGAVPLKGIKVCALSTTEEAFWNCAQTNAEGEYSVGGLASGSYKVVFLPEESGYSYVFQFYNGQYSLAAATSIPVTEGMTDKNIDAELTAGGSVAGLVTDAASQAPLGKIAVCAVEPAIEFAACSRTDSQGQYLIPLLPYGRYYVIFAPFAEAGIEAEYLTQYYDGQSNPENATAIALPKNETRSGVNAALSLRHPRASVVTPAATPPAPARPHRPLKCRKGFKKKRFAKGRVRCVKVHHKKRRHRRHRHGSGAHPRVRHHRLDGARFLATLP